MKTEELLWWALGLVVLYRIIRFFWRRSKQRDAGLSVHGMRPPFHGAWHVYWGGSRASQNHHLDAPAQRWAFDFCIARDDAGDDTYSGAGQSNTDYFCFGRPILAPLDGEVIVVVDGIPDNVPGKLNEQMVYGNTVIIRHADRLHSVLAHLERNSLAVREGDHVTAGQVVGRCGNSGNSSEPHLHFHVQTGAGFEEGSGVQVFFGGLTEKRQGHVSDYSPVKGDVVEGK